MVSVDVGYKFQTRGQGSTLTPYCPQYNRNITSTRYFYVPYKKKSYKTLYDNHFFCDDLKVN